jgi:hypothetical protein
VKTRGMLGGATPDVKPPYMKRELVASTESTTKVSLVTILLGKTEAIGCWHPGGVCECMKPNFLEPPQGELPRIPLARTWVNRGVIRTPSGSVR